MGNVLRRMGLLLAAMAAGFLLVVPVQAAMVGTPAVIQAEQGRVDRQELLRMLAREDVRNQLTEMGIDPEVASQRVAALTDDEVAALNQRVQDLPAGGDVLGLLLLLFIIFLITDMIGATDVFPFVHPVRR